MDWVFSQRDGQSSVEAALLLPSLMVVVALLVQPACLLYTRSIMSSAANEAVRMLATTTNKDEVTTFVKRRLAAVPEVSVFHSGGPDDWVVEVEQGSDVSVAVTGHVKPLPLMGFISAALGTADSSGLALSVTAKGKSQQAWVEGSYDDWANLWS